MPRIEPIELPAAGGRTTEPLAGLTGRGDGPGPMVRTMVGAAPSTDDGEVPNARSVA